MGLRAVKYVSILVLLVAACARSPVRLPLPPGSTEPIVKQRLLAPIRPGGQIQSYEVPTLPHGAFDAALLWLDGYTTQSARTINLPARSVLHVNLGKTVLWVVMILAVVSMLDYFVHFVRTVDLGSEA